MGAVGLSGFTVVRVPGSPHLPIVDVDPRRGRASAQGDVAEPSDPLPGGVPSRGPAGNRPGLRRWKGGVRRIQAAVSARKNSRDLTVGEGRPFRRLRELLRQRGPAWLPPQVSSRMNRREQPGLDYPTRASRPTITLRNLSRIFRGAASALPPRRRQAWRTAIIMPFSRSGGRDVRSVGPRSGTAWLLPHCRRSPSNPFGRWMSDARSKGEGRGRQGAHRIGCSASLPSGASRSDTSSHSGHVETTRKKLPGISLEIEPSANWMDTLAPPVLTTGIPKPGRAVPFGLAFVWPASSDCWPRIQSGPRYRRGHGAPPWETDRMELATGRLA